MISKLLKLSQSFFKRRSSVPSQFNVERSELATNCTEFFVRHLTEAKDTDLSELAAIAPDCKCESHSVSRYSPSPVDNEELLTRFLFHPIHISNRGAIKPAAFSHVFSKGLSLNRERIATTEILITWFVEQMDNHAKANWTWHSIVGASCGLIRSITNDNNSKRSFCIYDSAEATNLAHAEIFACCEVVDDEDRGELRKQLFDAFNANHPIYPASYRDGSFLTNVPELYRSRIKADQQAN